MKEVWATLNWKRNLLLLLIAAAISVVAIGAIYGWWLNQVILITTYDTKAGADFWATWTLENRLFDAAIILTLLSMITIPQRSSLLTFISSISGTGQVLKRLEIKTAIAWRLLQVGGLFLFYISLDGYSVTGTNVAFLWMMMSHGSISISSDQLSTLFSLPFFPGTSSEAVISLIPAMEAYMFYVGLVGTFLLFTAARLAMSIFTDLMAGARDIYVIISKGLFATSLIVVMQILTVPLWTVNAGTYLTFLGLIVGLVASLIGGVLFMLMRVHSGDARHRLRGKITHIEDDLAHMQGEMMALRQEYESGEITAEEYRRRINLLVEDRAHLGSELRRLKVESWIPVSGTARNFGFIAVILIIAVGAFPVVQAFSYGIPMDGDKFLDWKFNYETKKEIDITNWAVGLDDMQIAPLDDLTSNATPEGEVESLTTVRQWDQPASYLRMKNQIGTNWMQLADSDIVYLRGHEYWIAPLTFDEDRTKDNFINQHLIYTHTQGLVVLDAFSGDLIEHDDLVALFNREESINVYYGEDFDDVVFVNVPGFEEVGNQSYSSAPDYTLSGFESAFFTFLMGPQAWSFMGRDLNMLVQRDVVSRVRSIMLQGITVDRDPYIVVDDTGDLFYAVSVYIDYRLATGYAKEDYMRFLGVVLVNIGSGELSFYNTAALDSDFFIDATYAEYYPWQETPAWLQSQMKWSEDLYERQLEIAYLTHVEDGLVWRSARDFHQTPIGSDTRYIIMNIGGVERFVAMHNSEFRDALGRNLAGIYVMGCGDKDFGQLVFYSAGELGFSTLLGPNAAVQAFETADTVRTQLALWGEHRYGNRLLYHLGGELLFVIPVFLEVETSEYVVIEKLGGVGLVDAATGERVTLGSNVIEAYYEMFGLLNQTGVTEGDVGFESAVFNPITVDSGELPSRPTLELSGERQNQEGNSDEDLEY